MIRLGLEKRGNSASPDIAGALSFFRASSVLSRGAIAGAFVLTYVALEWISYIHEYKGLPITPWNPGLGVMFALMVFIGLQGAFVLFAGVVTAEILLLQSDVEWPIIIGIGAITSSSYAIVAEVSRRYLHFDAGLTHLRDVLLLLAAGFAGAVISACLLTVLLVASGDLDVRDVINASLPLLVGDVIGIAVLTPLLLRFALRRGGMLTLGRMIALVPEGVAYVVVIAGGLALIPITEGSGGFKFFYVLFLPVVMAAVRHGLDGACLGLALTQFGLVALVRLQGYDARAFTELQTLMFVLTATGLIVGVIVSERQNSERLVRETEARLKEKEIAAAQAARFNLVNGLASALAHEINQPMTAVRALARSVQQIVRTPGGDLTRADNNMTAMIAQIDHASGVVRRMRDFLRRGDPHVSTIDVRSMLEEALALIRAEASANQIRVELDASDDLPPAHGDRIQLEQVVLNLVQNAIEAIVAARLAQGCIRVVARKLDEPLRVEIGILDDGPGIEEKLADRLFAPLTTSKDEGLGLGLPICVSIIESHGGRLWLQSRKAGATELRFSLPLDQPKAP